MSKTSVAIFGVSGFLGPATLAAFESSAFADKFQFPIKVFTRDVSKKTSTAKVTYVQGDLSEAGVPHLIEELKGVDVVVELVSPNPEVFGAIEKAVIATKPKLFIPSQFGMDISKASEYFPGMLGIKTAHSKTVRDGGVKVVDIVTGLFAVEGTLLYEIMSGIGIDTEKKTVTYFGEPTSTFSISKLSDIGNAVAAVASHNPATLPDTLKVKSQDLSFKEAAERYEQTHNVKLAVSQISKEEALAQGVAKYRAGFDFSDFLYYLHVIASQGEDRGLAFAKSDNELLNPGESLWKYEKY